jgi:ABC-type transport system substrate-binding protein
MKIRKTKSAILVGVILALFVASSFAVRPQKVQAVEPFFTLVAKTNYGGPRPDYLNFFAQHVAKIGIAVDAMGLDWGTYVNDLLGARDLDLGYIGFCGSGDPAPFMETFYHTEGALNLFTNLPSTDWNETYQQALVDWYIEEAMTIMPPDSEERIQHIWDLEQHICDELVLFNGGFGPKTYEANWAELEGYDIGKGITQSWGSMYYTAAHEGQASTSAYVWASIADWIDLNPLFSDDTTSGFIEACCMDPLITQDDDLSIWPMMASDYMFLNDTHARFTLREGIKWQLDPDGLFPDEEMTAADAFFTYYCYKHISPRYATYDWIKDLAIVDKYTFDIFIDGDPDTPENDPYAPFFDTVIVNILPEHYLNQSQEADGVTPDISHPAWNTFSTHCFGTACLEFDSYVEGVETVMTFFDDCWMVDDTVDKSGMDFVNRYGDVWALDTMKYRPILDTQTILLEFEAGKLDSDQGACTQYPDKRDDYFADPRFEMQSIYGWCFGLFHYNIVEGRTPIGSMDPCPNDPSLTIGQALRKAMNYALDRNEINNVLHRGEYDIAYWPIPAKYGIWCNPNIIRYEHDLDKAKEYMEKAGYTIVEPSPVVTTTSTPGFGVWITLSSMLAISTVTVVFIKKKRK